MANAHSAGYNTAKKNYPKYWTKEQMKNLVRKNKLFSWEYEEIVGEAYKE